MGQDGTNRRVIPVPVKLDGLVEWTWLHPDRSYRLSTEPMCTSLFWSSQGNPTRPADFWPLTIMSSFPQFAQELINWRSKVCQRVVLARAGTDAGQQIKFHSQMIHHLLVRRPVEIDDGLRPNNHLKVRWSNRWRSAHQSVDDWISNCPYLFETRTNAYDEGILRSVKRSAEGRVQTKQWSADGWSVERPQVLRSVEGLVNAWVKDLSEMVEQSGRLKVHELIKVTIEDNWMMVDHSRPIEWRQPLKSAWLKATDRSRSTEGGRSRPIGWRSDLSRHSQLMLRKMVQYLRRVMQRFPIVLQIITGEI